MRLNKFLPIAFAALALLGGRAFASSDINEVGALLVFPLVTTQSGPLCPPELSCPEECFGNCFEECGEDSECLGFCIPGCFFECFDIDLDDATAPSAGKTATLNSGAAQAPLGAPAPKGSVTKGGTAKTAPACDGPACPDVVLAETFLTVTNAGAAPVVAHFTYFDGNEQDLVGTYCEECDFSIPLTGNDSEVLVLTSNGTDTFFRSEDSAIEVSCPFSYGMVVVSLEDATGATLTDNVLLGDAVIVNYAAGSAFSLPAVSFQGGSGDGDRVYRFDDNEYSRLPRIVAASFLAPSANSGVQSVAALNLFTLDFERHHAPLTDCSVTGYDADEKPFSASFQFGCWTVRDLCEISPEFCYPNLGLFGDGDTHGWLQLNCKVDRDPEAHDGFETNGGVHGALIQQRTAGTPVSGGSSNVFFMGQATWATLLYQSVTTGDEATLTVETPSPGME